MRQLKIVGMDPSMLNWGLAGALLNPDTLALQVKGLHVVNPVLPTGKQVRVNTKDIARAQQLYNAVRAAIVDADAIFVEVPEGTQSARGMAGYAICCGILGVFMAQGFPIYELTPTEVKLAATGDKNATKADMINWGTLKHPEAEWPRFRGEISASKAEHCADALAAIYAGIKSKPFQQLLPILKKAA